MQETVNVQLSRRDRKIQNFLVAREVAASVSSKRLGHKASHSLEEIGLPIGNIMNPSYRIRARRQESVTADEDCILVRRVNVQGSASKEGIKLTASVES